MCVPRTPPRGAVCPTRRSVRRQDTAVERFSNCAQTDLLASSESATPQDWLMRLTMARPRPEIPVAGAMSRRVGVSGDPSRTVSSTESSRPSRITVKAVIACTIALVASSLATNRTSSTR